MSKIDPDSERPRLEKLYAGMSDLELESLGRDLGELTERAREALRSEMLERGLAWRKDPAGNQAELANDGNLLLPLQSYADVAQVSGTGPDCSKREWRLIS